MTVTTSLGLSPEAALARWSDRLSRCETYRSNGAEVLSRLVPKTAPLAREILSPLFAERWTRGTDNRLRTLDGAPADERDLRAALKGFLSALPEDPAAGRPYRDLRALVVDDPGLGVARRDREREEYLSALTTSTRANLPRYRASRVEAPRRPPLTDAERMRRDRARLRFDELEAVRRALHAWAEGFPHKVTDEKGRAAHRAALPERVQLSALVGWVGDLLALWWSVWDRRTRDGDTWALYAVQIGAPSREPGSPGPRVTRAEIRRVFGRTYRSRGADWVHAADYPAEQMRDLIASYDVLRDLDALAELGEDAERRRAADELAADLRALIAADDSETTRRAAA